MLRTAVPPRTATPSTSFLGSVNHTIIFKHPGYADEFGQNILLTLDGFDSQHGALHYGTAFVACAIVAGNAWNGYFTRERNGEPLELVDDDVLTETSYYFHVPSPTGEVYKYPIHPAFEHWSFPHGNLPPMWSKLASAANIGSNNQMAPPSASNLTSAILRRDERCRITSQRDYIETAHLCPRSEIIWFESNYMARYCLNGVLSNDYITDDICNAIALRSDIHTAFDDKTFVIVPKESKWVAHFLGVTYDLGHLYHNTAISLDPTVSVNCLLTRFAWAIFPRVGKFISFGVARDLRLRIMQDGEAKYVNKTVAADEIRKMSTNTRSRSSSPKK
jgi:HNH endonuclease